jgi:hypothetical protein
VKLLDQTTALASGVFVRHKTDGSELETIGATYTSQDRGRMEDRCGHEESTRQCHSSGLMGGLLGLSAGRPANSV